MNESSTIIFYLNYNPELTPEFFFFSQLFKAQGCILVPVRVDQLQNLAAITEQEHIIVLHCVKKSEELARYNKDARHLLRYVLKSKRISFFNISSFKQSDDSKLYWHSKNYFFINLPIDAKLLTNRLVRYYQLKQTEKIAWPGGKKAGLSLLGV